MQALSPNDGELRAFLLRTICELVAIPSPSGREKAIADYVCARLKKSGLAPRRDDHDNVWVETGSGRGRLHFNAHLDTIVPVDGWRTDPFKPVVEGGLIYGLGSSDCKSGLAAMLWLAPRVKPRTRVTWSFTACEEGLDLPKPNGSERMAAMGGDWAIACEPTCDGETPTLGLGTQGHAHAVVRFLGKAAHSSVPEEGENAIYAAARFCAGLEKLNAGFSEVEIVPGSKARASAAATLIAGGKLSNVIPDSCEVTVSRRLAPGETVAAFEAELKRLLAAEKASFEISSDGPCALTDITGALLETARRAAAETGAAAPESFFRGRTDAVIYSRFGMDTLTLGPGQRGQCHVANEFTDLAGAVKCTRLLEALVNSQPDKTA